MQVVRDVALGSGGDGGGHADPSVRRAIIGRAPARALRAQNCVVIASTTR
jgi:hypothetical protein